MDKLNKKKISQEIEKIVDSNLQVISNDEEFKESLSEFNWSDLELLHKDVGEKIFEFIQQVSSIITNKEIINNLEDRLNDFNRLVELFFSDINNFSFKVKEIYEKHKDRTGTVQDFNEYDLYNRLSIQYNYLITELLSITAPTISEIILIVKEKIDDKKQKEVPVTNLESSEESKEVKNEQ